MLFKNSFDDKKIESLSNQIYSLIRNEPKLTNRSRQEIVGWMRSRSLYLVLEEDQVRGFIVREKITKNYYEVKSWFIRDHYRGSGLGEELLRWAVKDESKNYLSATFQKRIVKRLAGVGFKRASLAHIPLGVSLRYVLSRNLGSVLRHFFRTKSNLLAKNAR